MHVQFAQKAFIKRDRHVLLIQKSAHDPFNPGKWELPGGRLKRDESLDDALAREVLEEVGISVRVGRPLAVWSWQLGNAPDATRVVAVARLCEADLTDVSFGGHDDSDFIENYAWIDQDAVLGLDLMTEARPAISQCLEST